LFFKKEKQEQISLPSQKLYIIFVDFVWETRHPPRHWLFLIFLDSKIVTRLQKTIH